MRPLHHMPTWALRDLRARGVRLVAEDSERLWEADQAGPEPPVWEAEHDHDRGVEPNQAPASALEDGPRGPDDLGPRRLAD